MRDFLGGGALGLSLAIIGVHYTSWQFWLISAAALFMKHYSD